MFVRSSDDPKESEFPVSTEEGGRLRYEKKMSRRERQAILTKPVATEHLKNSASEVVLDTATWPVFFSTYVAKDRKHPEDLDVSKVQFCRSLNRGTTPSNENLRMRNESLETISSHRHDSHVCN